MSMIALIIIYGIIAFVIVGVIVYIRLVLAIRRVDKARARLHEITNDLKRNWF